MMVKRAAIVGIAMLMLAACDTGSSGSENTEDGAASESGLSEGGSANIESQLANAYNSLAQGNLAEAADLARSIILVNPNKPEVYLLLARAEARLKNTGNATDALSMALDKGFHDPRGAINHPDFDQIRNDEQFIALSRKYAAKASPSKAAASKSPPSQNRSTITSGDVSITEDENGRSRIRAGDIVIED